MMCSIRGCSGEYEYKRIVHTVHKGDEIFVFDHVPAEVCSVCGDTLLEPEAIGHLEALLKPKSEPQKLIPLYNYVYGAL